MVVEVEVIIFGAPGWAGLVAVKQLMIVEFAPLPALFSA
jgi:hypothetical protein